MRAAECVCVHGLRQAECVCVCMSVRVAVHVCVCVGCHMPVCALIEQQQNCNRAGKKCAVLVHCGSIVADVADVWVLVVLVVLVAVAVAVSVSHVRHSTTFTLPTTTIDTSESCSGSSPTIVSISEAFVQLVSL